MNAKAHAVISSIVARSTTATQSAVFSNPKKTNYDAYMPYMPMNALQFDDVAGVFPLSDMARVVEALAMGRPALAPRGRKP